MGIRITVRLLAILLGFTSGFFALATEAAEPGTGLGGPAALRKQLLVEFAEAYPAKASWTGRSRHYELVAAESVVEQFDGKKLRVWSYNGQVPGPILRVRVGEELRVTLRNELPQPTTIHWHGVRVPNAMDGVPGVTQSAIEPGETFEYRFIPKDAGTFWFHPHVRTSEQVERGLYGVLIVEDAQPLPYTRDEVWVLDDWRLGPDGEVDPHFVTRHDLAHDGRWGRNITVNGSSKAELVLHPGERIRLRLVNTSNGRVFRPDFSGLDARIIAVDGMYTRHPIAAEEFDLASGNRLDLDISIPSESSSKPVHITDRFTRQAFTLATIRVDESKSVEPPVFEPPANPRVPRWELTPNMPIDVLYALNARRGGPYGIEWTINDRVWGEHEATKLIAGKWTRVRFRNDSPRLHPMHLHGQFFKVLARNSIPVDEPYFRDTVLLRRDESVDVAMVPIDWGRWVMHCHILEHAEAGMMTLVEVGGEGGGKSKGEGTEH